MISSTKNVLKEKQNDSKTKESKDVKVAKESEDTNDFEIYEVAEDTKECKNAKEFKSSNDIKVSEDTNDCEIIKDFEDFEINEVSEDIKDFEITQVSKETNVTPTLAKEYKGSSYCSHNKIKSQCIHCGGKGLCCHGRQKSRCKDCKTGTSICPHGNVNSRCKLCKGSSYCEHGIIKYTCRDCKGGSICEHQRRRDQCFDCLGGAYCKHKIRKNYCKECGGSSLCKSEWCTISGMKKYNGYCLNCCINICPDIEVYRNYKTKEKEVVDEVIKEFPDFTWIADKKIAGGCSKRRPDLLLDMGDNIIIIEVDENKHTSYDCSCENKRLMEISQDVGHRPIIFLRFNPDGYETDEGIKVTSCWKANIKGILQIARNKKVEWKNRIKSLTDTISYWINNKTEKTIEIIELFY